MAFDQVTAAPAKAGKTKAAEIEKVTVAPGEDPTAKLDDAIKASNDAAVDAALEAAVAAAEASLADPSTDASPVLDELEAIEPAHNLILDARALAQQAEDDGVPDNAAAMHALASQLGDLHRTIVNLQQQTTGEARAFLAHISKWF